MTHEEIEAAIERIRAIEPSDYVGNAPSVAKVVWGFMGGNASAMELRDVLIDLLRQADPDTHMELPVDAGGECIHIGDELCGYGYPHGGAYCMAINGKDVVFVSELGSMSYKDMLLWDPIKRENAKLRTAVATAIRVQTVLCGDADMPYCRESCPLHRPETDDCEACDVISVAHELGIEVI